MEPGVYCCPFLWLICFCILSLRRPAEPFIDGDGGRTSLYPNSTSVDEHRVYDGNTLFSVISRSS